MPLDTHYIILLAREIIKQQKDIDQQTDMTKWYRGFRRRHSSSLSDRTSESVTQRRMVAEHNQPAIDRYYSLLKNFQSYPPDRLYAGDETGLDGDGDRKHKVLVPTGVKKVITTEDSYREHTSILHICNATGMSLPPIIVHKGDSLDIDMAKQIATWRPKYFIWLPSEWLFHSRSL